MKVLIPFQRLTLQSSAHRTKAKRREQADVRPFTSVLRAYETLRRCGSRACRSSRSVRSTGFSAPVRAQWVETANGICLLAGAAVPHRGARRQPETISAGPSQIAAQLLLPLDRLKQRFEIAFAEAAAALSLDDFEENRGPVLDRTREDLEHVSLVVAIDQDPQML